MFPGEFTKINSRLVELNHNTGEIEHRIERAKIHILDSGLLLRVGPSLFINKMRLDEMSKIYSSCKNLEFYTEI